MALAEDDANGVPRAGAGGRFLGFKFLPRRLKALLVAILIARLKAVP